MSAYEGTQKWPGEVWFANTHLVINEGVTREGVISAFHFSETRVFDLFSLDNIHWVLIVVDIIQRSIHYHDSCHAGMDEQIQRLQNIERFMDDFETKKRSSEKNPSGLFIWMTVQPHNGRILTIAVYLFVCFAISFQNNNL